MATKDRQQETQISDEAAAILTPEQLEIAKQGGTILVSPEQQDALETLKSLRKQEASAQTDESIEDEGNDGYDQSPFSDWDELQRNINGTSSYGVVIKTNIVRDIRIG